MALYSLGDMASHFMLRRQNVRMNAELAQLSQELATGRTADIPRHLRGNYSYLGDVERSLRVLEGYETGAREAVLFTGAMQSALGKVQSTATSLSADLVPGGKHQPAAGDASRFDQRQGRTGCAAFCAQHHGRRSVSLCRDRYRHPGLHLGKRFHCPAQNRRCGRGHPRRHSERD